MMWMMLVCMLPILLVSFAGGAFASNKWLLVGMGIVIVTIAHSIIMRNWHGDADNHGLKTGATIRKFGDTK